MARFITLKALKEVTHDLDTCANESVNNAISWLAPKTKFTVDQTLSRIQLAWQLVSKQDGCLDTIKNCSVSLELK